MAFMFNAYIHTLYPGDSSAKQRRTSLGRSIRHTSILTCMLSPSAHWYPFQFARACSDSWENTNHSEKEEKMVGFPEVLLKHLDTEVTAFSLSNTLMLECFPLYLK